MSKNKKKGLLLILSPWVIMIANYLVYFLSRTVFHSVLDNTGGDILRVVLGLIGTLNFIWIFVGTIIGIIFLTKSETLQTSHK
jgi:hypothetical protein